MSGILSTATMTVLLVLAPGVSAHAGGTTGGRPDSSSSPTRSKTIPWT